MAQEVTPPIEVPTKYKVKKLSAKKGEVIYDEEVKDPFEISSINNSIDFNKERMEWHKSQMEFYEDVKKKFNAAK